MNRITRSLRWLRPVPYVALARVQDKCDRLQCDYDRLTAIVERREADWEDQSEKYQKKIEQCRLTAQEATRDRDAAVAELAHVRRELETARQDQSMRSRASGEAIACGQSREKEALRLAREMVAILERGNPA